jgi:hypothetical protein
VRHLAGDALAEHAAAAREKMPRLAEPHTWVEQRGKSSCDESSLRFARLPQQRTRSSSAAYCAV